jgi:hypothetical protein
MQCIYRSDAATSMYDGSLCCHGMNLEQANCFAYRSVPVTISSGMRHNRLFAID